jgi:DNA-directed RNA polymerase specialized sigma24 family protein
MTYDPSIAEFSTYSGTMVKHYLNGFVHAEKNDFQLCKSMNELFKEYDQDQQCELIEKRYRPHEPESCDLGRKDTLDILMKFLEKQKIPYRQELTDWFLNGKTQVQIGLEAGVSKTAVQGRIGVALQAIKRKVNRDPEIRELLESLLR